jgi:hypothetical protein
MPKHLTNAARKAVRKSKRGNKAQREVVRKYEAAYESTDAARKYAANHTDYAVVHVRDHESVHAVALASARKREVAEVIRVYGIYMEAAHADEVKSVRVSARKREVSKVTRFYDIYVKKQNQKTQIYKERILNVPWVKKDSDNDCVDARAELSASIKMIKSGTDALANLSASIGMIKSGTDKIAPKPLWNKDYYNYNTRYNRSDWDVSNVTNMTHMFNWKKNEGDDEEGLKEHGLEFATMISDELYKPNNADKDKE